MEGKLKHLEMIQAVINRLAANSFLAKGWSLTLVSALFAISASGANDIQALLAFIPAVVFWGLDGYFLWEERKFRGLYDLVRRLDASEIDFSMDTSLTKKKLSWTNALFSVTLAPFHFGLLGSILVVNLLSS